MNGKHFSMKYTNFTFSKMVHNIFIHFIGYSNTARQKRQRKTAVIFSATNHCTDKHDVILNCLMTSAFIFITLDCVTSFSRVKTHEIHVNAFITVRVFSGFLTRPQITVSKNLFLNHMTKRVEKAKI